MLRQPFRFNVPICKKCIREHCKSSPWYQWHSNAAKKFEVGLDEWLETAVLPHFMPCPYQNFGRKVLDTKLIHNETRWMPKNIRQIEMPKRCQYPLEQIINQV